MMDTTAFKGNLKQQADTHGLELEVPKNILDLKLNEYWNQVKDLLAPDIVKAALKGGYRKVERNRVVDIVGGPNEFFKPVLSDLVQAYMDAQPRQALLINEVSMQETLSFYIITAIVQLEPAVTWKSKPGIDAPLVVKVPKEPDNIIETLVDNELKVALQKAVILVPQEGDGGCTVGQVVVVDCDATIDGVKWDKGTFTAQKWPLEKEHYFAPEIYDAIIGKKQEERIDVEFTLGEAFNDLAGKTVKTSIRLIQFFDKKTGVIDDDLAKSNGFATLDAFKTDLAVKAGQYMETNRNTLVGTTIVNALVNPDVLDVEAIPARWIVQKAKEIYVQARGKVSSEEELIEQLSGQQLSDGTLVSDKQSILVWLAEKTGEQFLVDLVIRDWGKMKGVPGDSGLSNIREYTEAVRNELKKIVVIETVEMEVPIADV